MERREPTLSTGNLNEPADTPARRPVPAHDDLPPPRQAPRTSTTYHAPPPPRSSSALPAIALIIALVAVGGAGYLAWQLLQAQGHLQQAEARIANLEQKLNLTSEESSASVVTLQANLKTLDSELRKLSASTEDNRKALAVANEKINAVGRDTAVAKKDGADAKAGLNSLKQEVTTSKAAVDAAIAKVDTMAGGISQQAQNLQSLRERLDRMQLELAAIDSIAAKTRTNEEAIAAIDEFRRSTNRELLQIRQQIGLVPK
ncbi:hypothetical protein [Cellvibrio japonicus]|uniref:ATPase n=1 Tax=Cellvibrio japonicus (strain Ueda107) TaxID=498211 RepID=B3PLM4_CELJU|nr:hypothetical protein [Cellvibrio japonicus]ACE83853.1 hypothetical protein CJA_2643 [Cellvibrio japonicus Ueda107]QEI13010.1 hypothetical protein FY117_12780 [Cellvibrio japonicus]QEI16584.1 hypothetical protein FY116_12785 [Cellvibrio japonicus]QEI20162.1 hypothetical protein FY115_12780 [Cellvibrio japonicus]